MPGSDSEPASVSEYEADAGVEVEVGSDTESEGPPPLVDTSGDEWDTGSDETDTSPPTPASDEDLCDLGELLFTERGLEFGGGYSCNFRLWQAILDHVLLQLGEEQGETRPRRNSSG